MVCEHCERLQLMELDSRRVSLVTWERWKILGCRLDCFFVESTVLDSLCWSKLSEYLRAHLVRDSLTVERQLSSIRLLVDTMQGLAWYGSHGQLLAGKIKQPLSGPNCELEPPIDRAKRRPRKWPSSSLVVGKTRIYLDLWLGLVNGRTGTRREIQLTTSIETPLIIFKSQVAIQIVSLYTHVRLRTEISDLKWPLADSGEVDSSFS